MTCSADHKRKIGIVKKAMMECNAMPVSIVRTGKDKKNIVRMVESDDGVINRSPTAVLWREAVIHSGRKYIRKGEQKASQI